MAEGIVAQLIVVQQFLIVVSEDDSDLVVDLADAVLGECEACRRNQNDGKKEQDHF